MSFFRRIWRRCCDYLFGHGREGRDGGVSPDSIGEGPDVVSAIDGVRVSEEGTSFDGDLIASSEMGKGESMQSVAEKPKMTPGRRNRIKYALEEGKREEKKSPRRPRNPVGMGEGGAAPSEVLEEEDKEEEEIIINKIDD